MLFGGHLTLSHSDSYGEDLVVTLTNTSSVMRQVDSRMVITVEGVSAAMAGGVSAVITMPLDTIKTRLQVMDGGSTIGQTVSNLVRGGGWLACYKGLGPRAASMSMSATAMITTCEFLKHDHE